MAGNVSRVRKIEKFERWKSFFNEILWEKRGGFVLPLPDRSLKSCEICNFDTQNTELVTRDTWQKFVCFFLEGSSCHSDDVGSSEIKQS
jgi:hypothetical protein